MKISNVKHREIDFAVSQNTARGEEVNSINIDESSLIFSKNREVESGTGIITDYLTHQGEEWLFAKNSADTLCFILLDPDNKKSALINFTRSCDIEKTILMTLDNMGANYLANSHGLSATLYGGDSDLLFSVTHALQTLAIPVNNDEPVQASSKSQCVLFDLSTGQCKPYHKTMESSPADTHDEGDEKTVKFKALTFNTEKNNEKEEAENNHCVSDDEDDVYFDANDVFLPENRQQVTAVGTQQSTLQEYNKIVEFVAPIAGKLIWDFLRQILPQLQLKDKTPTELMADTAVVKTLYENILFIYNDTTLPIQSKIAAMLTLLAEIETQLPGRFTQLLSWLREFSALLNHTAIQTPDEAIRSHEQGLLSSNLVSFCSRLNNVISHEFLQNVLPASENDVLIKLKQMAELFPCFLSAGLDYQPALSEFIDGLIHHPVLKTHLPYVKYLVDVAETVYQQVNDLQVTISGYPAGGSYGQKLLWLAEVLSNPVVSKHVEGIIPVPLLNLLKFPQLFNQMASSYPPDANYVSQMSWLLAQMNSVQLQESIKNTPLEYLLVSVNNQINDSSAISALRFMYSVFNDAREGASTARAVLSKLTAAEALKYYAAIATPLLPVSIPFLPVSVPLIPTILGVKWLADIYRSMPENLSLKDASYWIIEKLSREINDPMIRSVIVGGRKGLSLLADIKNFFRDMPCDMSLSGVFDFLINKFQALPQNAAIYKFYIYGCLAWQLKKSIKMKPGLTGLCKKLKIASCYFRLTHIIRHGLTWLQCWSVYRHCGPGLQSEIDIIVFLKIYPRQAG